MITDYEQAWIGLQDYIAGKTQHGREGLLAKMAGLAQECRVPAGEMSRLLRLYGVEVERARAISVESAPSDEERFRAEHIRAGIDSPGAIIDSGGHDGDRNGAAGHLNGRRRA